MSSEIASTGGAPDAGGRLTAESSQVRLNLHLQSDSVNPAANPGLLNLGANQLLPLRPLQAPPAASWNLGSRFQLLPLLPELSLIHI